MIIGLDNPLICVVIVNDDCISALIVEKIAPQKRHTHTFIHTLPYAIKALARTPISGFDKGRITHTHKLARAIEQVIGMAEKQANLEVDTIYFSAALAMTKTQTCVVEKNLDHAHVRSSDISELEEQYAVYLKNIADTHCVPLDCHYTVDGNFFLSPPYNQKGIVLQSYCSFFELPQCIKQQLNSLVYQLNFKNVYYGIYEYAYAHSVHLPNKKATPFMCLHINKQTTQIIEITNSRLRFSNQIAIGLETVMDSITEQFPDGEEVIKSMLFADKQALAIGEKTIKKPTHCIAMLSDAMHKFASEIRRNLLHLGYDDFLERFTCVGISGAVLRVLGFQEVFKNVLQVPIHAVYPTVKIRDIASKRILGGLKVDDSDHIILAGMLHNIELGYVYQMDNLS